MDRHRFKPADVKPRKQSYAGRVAMAVLIAGTALAAIVLLVYQFTSEQAPTNQGWRAGLGAEIFQGAQFRPEKRERRAFILFCLALPLAAWSSLKVVSLVEPSKYARFLPYAAAAGAGLGLYWVWQATARDRGLVWGTLAPFVVPGFRLAVVLLLLILVTRRFPERTAYRVVSEVIGLIACVALACYEMSPGWMSVYATTHLEPILFPMMQVMEGRTVLVDVQSVYGLFPHFLEPVFKLLPLSVSSFSFVMALLLFVTLYSVYRFLRLSSPGPLTATIAFLGYLFGPFTTLNAGYPHYQCYPLRTVFPALMLWLGARYLKCPTPLRLAMLAMAAGLSLLWNLDSGIACVGGVLALLVAQGSARRLPRAARVWLILRNVTWFTLTVATTLLCGVGYLCVRSGQFPRLGELAAFQAIFYEDGFLMEPMQPLGGWWLVIILYVWAMVSALAVHFRGGSRRLSPRYAMLAVLGLGLFAYYQGRSVVPNLYYVAWPAYLVCGLFLGDLTRQSRRWLLRLQDPWQGTDQAVQLGQLATVVFSLSLLVASAIHCQERVGMLSTWPEYQATYGVYKRDWQERIHPVMELLPASGDKRPVLVLSARDHLWHLFLKQPSVLSNAGFNHIFRADEFEGLCRLIEERQIACVVWDETYLQTPMPEIQYGYVSQTEKGKLLASLRKSYCVAAVHAGKGDLPFSVWVPGNEALAAGSDAATDQAETLSLSRRSESQASDFTRSVAADHIGPEANGRRTLVD